MQVTIEEEKRKKRKRKKKGLKVPCLQYVHVVWLKTIYMDFKLHSIFSYQLI